MSGPATHIVDTCLRDTTGSNSLDLGPTSSTLPATRDVAAGASSTRAQTLEAAVVKVHGQTQTPVGHHCLVSVSVSVTPGHGQPCPARHQRAAARPPVPLTKAGWRRWQSVGPKAPQAGSGGHAR